LTTDQSGADELCNQLRLEEDNEAFSGEHSVGIIIPFVRYYFPDARVLSIIVQRQVPKRMQRGFCRWLDAQLRDPHTIVLLSMDFSHYQTSDEADRRDQLSGRAILELNESLVDQLDIDCHSGFGALLGALNEQMGIKPIMCCHTNSAKITGKTDISSVTSYHTVLFIQSATPPPLPKVVSSKRVFE
jgi:hypothetical protein